MQENAVRDGQMPGSSVSDSEGRILDRPLDLTAIPSEWILWLTVLLAALGVRLVGRTNWPLTAGESSIARDAFALVQGNDLSGGAASHPALVQLTALMFFLFGDSDYTARLVPLLAGLGVIGVLFWVRRWAGNLPALAAAIVFSVSPVMTMSSMRLDGAMLLVLANLAILSLVFSMSVGPGVVKSVLLGVVLALAITVHPLGWIFAPLVLVLAALMVRDPELIDRLRYTLSGFVISLLIITTHFATRPSAAVDFFGESWSALWNDHVATGSEDWHLTVLALLVEEPIAVAMALTGLVLVLLRVDWSTSAPRALVIAAAAWVTPTLTLGLLLGGKGPALYAVSIFPVILLAGFGLSMVIEGALASGYQWRRIALTVLLGLILLVALGRLFELVGRGSDGDTLSWIVSALVLGSLVVLPLGIFTLRLVRELGLAVVPMSLLAVALILGVAGLRSSLLLPITTTERPGEILLGGSSAPSLAQLEQRLKTYSRDATTYDQDVRDPTGGHGLVIALEQSLADPFAWYFRDFPNLMIVEAAGELDRERAPDVIIASPDSSQEYVQALESYGARNYASVYRLPESLRDPSILEGARRIVNPLEFSESLKFLVYRDTESPPEIEQFTLLLHEDHALVFWGSLPE